ncbi:MAG: CoA pyrophosphatase [Rhodospirillales bacterium]|nr:CoA pyrophosphatase [Rhodospirillales bacterium]
MAEDFPVNHDLRAAMAQRLDAFKCQPQEDEGLKRAAVTMTVISDSRGRGAFILTRRAPRMNRHAGQWALPGGRLDPGETPEEAALRELEEEVNLSLPPDAVLGRLDDYPTRSGYLITPVVIWAGERVELVPNPDEVASIHRVRFSILFRPGSPEFVEIPESDRPVIRMPMLGSKIHAPTAAVMYQFREVALAGRDTRVAHLEQPVFAWK